ncbi:MAG TPA: response regulator [Desulfomonilaceae bacterium]|nr:response regulator [Desulfomonilaceae bacterium]
MPYRIVVADKDPRSQEAVRRFLPQDNEYIGVSSSAELKQSIKDERPDLIILNAVLADSPNWGAVQRVVKGIKGSRDYGDIPVLLMTGDPGSPLPTEVSGAGADGYLAKPIDATTLKQAVESLLGVSEPTLGDEEIMIDFTDDDSGDMTEELLAMSNVALDSEEPSTDVGDTVEIDTGTLVAELDHSGDVAGEDTYEDTVRLNLEDMGLEDDLDESTSFEPTIELVADIPADFGPSGDAADVEAVDIDLDDDEPLPDFSVTKDVAAPASAKDSVTVDMDVDELGLELDTEEPMEGISQEIEQIDADDTEIGQILEIQEPSQVLMSKDLDLDSNLIAKEPTSEIDIIDLEDDTEIRDMDIEELESVQLRSDSVGFDLEDTVPVEAEEMEQLAGEDLTEIDLEETESEDVPPLEIESPIEAATPYESDELQLDEVGEEEITTQEFFGEELPTEEFPTEKYPDDRTREHVLMEHEIDLEHAAAPDEIALAPEPSSQETPFDEMTLDGGIGEEALFDQTDEEEPMLEVTEDISFDEITFDTEEDTTARASEAPPAKTEERTGISAAEAVVGAAAVAAAAVVGGAALKGFTKQPEAASIPTHAPVTPVQMPVAPPATHPEVESPHVAAQAALPTPQVQVPGFSREEMKELMNEVLGAHLKEMSAGKLGLTDTVQSALRDELQKTELSETVRQIVQSALPSKQEILDGVLQNISHVFPNRDEVFGRVDDSINGMLPGKEALSERIDEAMRRILPSREEIDGRVDRAIEALPSHDAVMERVENALKVIPSKEEMDRRFQDALGSLPTPEAVLDRIDQALKSIPKPEEIEARFETALKSLPNSDAILERVDQALRAIPTAEEVNGRFEAVLGSFPDADAVYGKIDDALAGIPSQEHIHGKIEEALAGLPSREVILDRVDAALQAIPTEQSLNTRFEELLSALPAPEVLLQRIDSALSAVPTKEEIQYRFDQIITALPEPGTILERIDSSLKAIPTGAEIDARFKEAISALPSPDEVNQKFDAALEAIPSRTFMKEQLDSHLRVAISPELVAERLDTALRGIPSQEYIRMRLDTAFGAFPSPDMINERLNNALKAVPSQPAVEARIDAALAGLPGNQAIMERIDSALGGLPGSEAFLGLVEERLGAMIPDREDVQQAFRTLLETRIEQVISQADLKESIVRLLPDTENILGTIVTALPEKERFQEALTQSLTDAIRNSLPERTWLESLSRGMFDDRARGILPKKEEVVELLREEIRSKLLDTVEKAIKAQIEKITTELP